DVVYHTRLFDRSTIDRWARYFQELAGALADTPERCVFAVPLLSASERAAIVRGGRGEPGAAGAGDVVAAFTAQARARADAIAVEDADRVVSYGELQRTATVVAAWLRRRDIGAGALA